MCIGDAYWCCMIFPTVFRLTNVYICAVILRYANTAYLFRRIYVDQCVCATIMGRYGVMYHDGWRSGLIPGYTYRIIRLLGYRGYLAFGHYRYPSIASEDMDLYPLLNPSPYTYPHTYLPPKPPSFPRPLLLPQSHGSPTALFISTSSFLHTFYGAIELLLGPQHFIFCRLYFSTFFRRPLAQLCIMHLCIIYV